MNNWATRPNKLYPAVDETDTPLPRKWNPLDKPQFITLHVDGLLISCSSERNVLKATGNVRSTHPIPAACGIFYFEIKVIKNVGDGYIRIGVSVDMTNLYGAPCKPCMLI